MKINLVKALIWALFFFVVAKAFSAPCSAQESAQLRDVSYSEFREMVLKGKIAEVKIFPENRSISAALRDKKNKNIVIKTVYPEGSDLIKLLEQNNVKITVEPSGQDWAALLGMIPLVLMLVFFIIMMRGMAGIGNRTNRFTSSKAKLFQSADGRKITFADVAGSLEVKQELEEIVEFLRNPKKFTSLGGEIPKGVLLSGPPGTGKTLLARAVAGEAGVRFFSITGSDFVEMFVGVGAARVRDLFETGKRSAPCIIFIDEIDAIGKTRAASASVGSHEEREQTLNQLLAEMSGFQNNVGVIVIAATNRFDVLDPALLRPGRFDRMIAVPLPDLAARLAILEVHTRKRAVGDVDLKRVARATPGLSGAHLENICNEAALLAGRQGKTAIDAADFDGACDKVIFGLARKDAIVSPRERKIIRYHEAGHAIVSLLTADAPHPQKVTIIQHGQAGGFTRLSYEDDKNLLTRGEILAQIKVALGGRAAEEIFCREQTTGASDDLRRATELARGLVLQFGMHETLGLSVYSDDSMFGSGSRGSSQFILANETKRQVDEAVKDILDQAYVSVKKLLEEKRDKVEKLAELLEEKETVVFDEEMIKRLS